MFLWDGFCGDVLMMCFCGMACGDVIMMCFCGIRDGFCGDVIMMSCFYEKNLLW